VDNYRSSLFLILTFKTSSIDSRSSNYRNWMPIFGLFFHFYLLSEFWLWLDLVNFGWLSSKSTLILLKTSFYSKSFNFYLNWKVKIVLETLEESLQDSKPNFFLVYLYTFLIISYLFSTSTWIQTYFYFYG